MSTQWRSSRSASRAELAALLTTETCAPTQAWPARLDRDWPAVRALSALLLDLGGGGTVSKLRGALKGRLALAESVKSVPLKAFLAAYADHFSVAHNRVTLARVA